MRDSDYFSSKAQYDGWREIKLKYLCIEFGKRNNQLFYCYICDSHWLYRQWIVQPKLLLWYVLGCHSCMHVYTQM